MRVPPTRTLIVAAAGATIALGVAYYIRRRRVQPARPTPTTTSARPRAQEEPQLEKEAHAAVQPQPQQEEAEVDSQVAEKQEEQREQAKRAKERGNKRFQGRQYQLAIVEYSQAIELSPDPLHKDVAVFYGNRAQCYASLDDYELAEQDCDSALRIDQSYVKALCRRAIAREKLGKVEPALLDLTAACMLSGFQNEMASTNTDRLIKDVGRVKAEAKLKEPMLFLPSPFFISTFVDSFKEHREVLSSPRQSLPQLSLALQADDLTSGKHAMLLSERALAHMACRQYEEALVDWSAAAEQVPPCARAGSEAQQQALAEWSAASEAGDAIAPALGMSMLGMLLHLRGNYDDAMERYNQALAMRPTSIDVLLKRSSLWFEKENLPKAHTDFDAAIAIDASHPDIYCHRGQLYMMQNELGTAIKDLRKAMQLDPDSMLASIQLGMALHRNQQATEARSVFEQAEARFPTSPDVLNYHGELLVETGELELARAKFEAAISVSEGRFALAHVNKGVLKLHENQDLEGAIELCEKAVEVDPLCETAHVHMAHLCLQKNDLESAVASYDRAVGLLRMKQELIDCFSMREAAAAQLALLREQPALFGPVMEENRKRAAAAAGAAGMGMAA